LPGPVEREEDGIGRYPEFHLQSVERGERIAWCEASEMGTPLDPYGPGIGKREDEANIPHRQLDCTG
jgi:hypothetical protein